MSHLAPKGFSQTRQTSSQRMSTVSSNEHSQLKNNQQRPSSCCSRKAAPCNSHKCRLVLANNNLVPARPGARCHLFGVALAARIRHRSQAEEGAHISPAAAQGSALGQLWQQLQVLVLSSAPSLHQQCYWHN